MKTHRCEGSLNASVSIRKAYESDILRLESDKETWRLFIYEYDYDFNLHIQRHISKIKYCPYCGEKLDL